MIGELGILNVGAGDTKLTFDKSNPAERARAAKIVTEMLQRGYSILVQVDKKDGEPVYLRAKRFDPETCEYIISGGPDEVVDVGDLLGVEREDKPARRKPGRPRKNERRIPADSTKAVSVGRTAGG